MNMLANNSAPPRPPWAAALSRTDQEFRQWLQQRGFWSDDAERLFLYLIYIEQLPAPITDQQKQLLAQVIEDALNGVNITERYPAFFRDLLHNAALRREFVTTAKQL